MFFINKLEKSSIKKEEVDDDDEKTKDLENDQ